MSSGITGDSSGVSYDRFNPAVNTNISLKDSANTGVGDKVQVVGSREYQKAEKLEETKSLQKLADTEVSMEGVENSAIALSPDEKKLINIVNKHGGGA